MATATMIPGDTQDLAEWLSHETIEFVESLETEMTCRIEAFTGRVSTVLREAALRVARDGVTTMLHDLGGAGTADPEPHGQNVLPLQPRAAAGAVTPRAADATAKPTAPPKGRAPRAPREGSIASEIETFLTANPDKAFTVTAIMNGLSSERSSGAVDAACKRMASRGELTQVGAAPRTYQLPGESR